MKKKFEFEKTVYLKDTNAEGNVYFSRFFEWQGEAREEFVKANVPTLPLILKSGIVFITCEAYTYFRRSAYLYDKVIIEVRTANIKKTSLELIFIYTNKETKEQLALGWQKLAFSDSQGKIIPIPEDIKNNALYFLEENPAQVLKASSLDL